MENQNQTNTQKDDKNALKGLEQEIKSAFKADNFELVSSLSEKIQAIDPENHLAKKLGEKVAEKKKKEEMKVNAGKIKEYEGMLKKMIKDGDMSKVKALATELREFDDKAADKWTKKAEKIEEKALKPSKPGLFSSLFAKKKKEEPALVASTPTPKASPVPTPAPVTAPTPMATTTPVATPTPVVAATPAPTPVAPVAPLASTPAASAPVAPVKKEEVKKEAPKGNMFTKMFKKDEKVDTKNSIIDTIVEKSKVPKEVKVSTDEGMAINAKPKKEEKGSVKHLVAYSKVFMHFTIVFIVFSAAFLYVEFVDEENTMLSLVGITENTGGKLYKAADEAQLKKREEAVLNKNIQLYKGGYSDSALDTVEGIIDNRINWPDIFVKINEVTNSVYELNDFFKYIEYNNYSFDAERGTIRVTGTLSDPLGRNLTRLVELEEAFMNFPRDKNNPDDPTKPYFQGFKEFNSFSKSLDKETGRYTSNFQLSFSLNK